MTLTTTTDKDTTPLFPKKGNYIDRIIDFFDNAQQSNIQEKLDGLETSISRLDIKVQAEINNAFRTMWKDIDSIRHTAEKMAECNENYLKLMQTVDKYYAVVETIKQYVDEKQREELHQEYEDLVRHQEQSCCHRVWHDTSRIETPFVYNGNVYYFDA